MLETPIRFQMTADEAAAACAVAGVPQSAVLSGTDRFVPTAERVLSDAGVLNSDGSLLAPVARVLDIIAHPTAVSTAVAHVIGSSEWRKVTMPSNTEGWVARAEGDDALDVMLAPTASAATVMLDDLFDLSTFSSRDGTLEIELSSNGWWSLLALTDARRAHLLTAELERRQAESYVVEAPAIYDALKAGLGHEDSRWLVTAIEAQSPVPVSGMDATAGMSELVDAGMTVRSNDAWSLTEDGASLLDALAQVISIGSVSQAVVVGSDRARVGEVTLLVGPLRLLMAVWGGLGTDRPSVMLAEVNSETALTLIRDLIRLGMDAPVA